MMWTPFGDLLTFDFIKAAIEGENLGNNPAGVPDILGISWTSHDYVNHLFGPESRQSQDQTTRLKTAIEVLGCSGGKMEKETEGSGYFEVDDAKCRDGQYDIKLDKDFKVIVMTRD